MTDFKLLSLLKYIRLVTFLKEIQKIVLYSDTHSSTDSDLFSNYPIIQRINTHWVCIFFLVTNMKCNFVETHLQNRDNNIYSSLLLGLNEVMCEGPISCLAKRSIILGWHQLILLVSPILNILPPPNFS